MPAALARSATSLPTAAGASARPVFASDLSWLDAAASVRPASSSISWAAIERFERYTASRGRSAVPDTLARTRRWRRRRACCFVFTAIVSLRSLSDLADDVLALVADALALVGLRRAPLADLGGDLADLLLARPADDDLRRLRHLEGDALRRLHGDGMAEAELHLEVGAPQRGAVADALDLEPLGEPGRDARDHVRDQRPGE